MAIRISRISFISLFKLQLLPAVASPETRPPKAEDRLDKMRASSTPKLTRILPNWEADETPNGFESYSDMVRSARRDAGPSYHELTCQRAIVVGTLRGTSRIVLAIPKDPFFAIHFKHPEFVFVATQYNEWDPAYWTKGGIGLADEAELTNMHGVEGFCPNARIWDLGLVEWSPIWYGEKNGQFDLTQTLLGLVDAIAALDFERPAFHVDLLCGWLTPDYTVRSPREPRQAMEETR
jgi:hypothetical protein